MKATLYTIIALIAFAANSLFCRMALAEGYIDAWSFTIIRLLGGAVCLMLIMTIHARRLTRQSMVNKNLDNRAILKDKGSWLSSISLVIYALCFSLAYVELDTGTGALILFAAVQLTMIGWGIFKKEQLSAFQWAAFVVAVVGFIYLMLPSAAVPSLSGAAIMAISGVAWGVYSIRGQACISPLRATGFNFIRSLVAVPILFLVAVSYLDNISAEGILLAAVSGAITSGIGYSIWYMAMPLLKSTQAAVVQFCVPVMAAIAGVLFLSEQLTLRFVIASAIILGAVLVFILNKSHLKPNSQH
ncbi:DMT family transporter [Psychrobacter sp. TAE2020]|uniref:DMT family transporter n=1 Tax=Psychrobacter sp. TAE2020 TaxID=2846762 RepID=UPI001C0F6702|nr:DMT family transporter [Psychrobacter sp. TAE2020]MBU5615607.1 DMT family transporter [Psychrobacter sp. TAE2020]